MTRDLCGVCGRRSGDRRCPSLDRSLCSACCGSHRGRMVRCPPDCSYGRVAEQRLRERRAKELDRAWAGWYRDLEASGEEAIWPYVEILAQGLAVLLHRDGASDAEVEEALRHLDRALSPVVLVAAPPTPLGRILAEKGFLQLVRNGKMDSEGLRKAVQALVSWLSAWRSPADPLKFARGLLGLFPALPEEPQLIVRPPEIG